METSELNIEQPVNTKTKNTILCFSSWVAAKNLPFLVITAGMVRLFLSDNPIRSKGARSLNRKHACGPQPFEGMRPVVNYRGVFT